VPDACGPAARCGLGKAAAARENVSAIVSTKRND
jgi:hypothetical protein